MILDSLKELHYLIDIKPHLLRVNPLRKNEISDDIISQIVSFTKQICERIDEITDLDYESAKKDLKSFTSKFKVIKNTIAKEIPDKKGDMKFVPSEYVEAIYIIVYKMNNVLDISQADAVEILGIDSGDLRDRWGISPEVDSRVKKSNYDVKFPLDNDTNFLQEFLPFLGKVSAETSNSNLLIASNELGILTNIPNTNKRGIRQSYFSINTIDDLLKWIFFENLPVSWKQIKTNIANLTDTSDIAINTEILEYALAHENFIKEDNLFFPEIDIFNQKYEQYKNKVKNRELFYEALESDDLDYSDIFLVDIRKAKEGEFINKEEVCKTEIERLTNEINSLMDYMLRVINIPSLVAKGSTGILSYVVDLYRKELKAFSPELLEDKPSLCSKYFVVEYFTKNGVSVESYNNLMTYMESSQLGDYVILMKNNQVSAFQNRVDIDDKLPLRAKIEQLSEKLNSKKENRVFNTALVVINSNEFGVSAEDIIDYTKIDDKIFFIIISDDKLQLEGFEEHNLAEKYVYTNNGGN